MMNFGFSGGFYGGFGMIFGLMFVIVIVFFIVVIAMGIRQWTHNNAQPVIERYCTVVTKRATTDVSHHNDANGHAHAHHSTSHYATFQFSDGSREEFNIGGREYGMLAEGDRGTLTSQGTRYKGFLRS